MEDTALTPDVFLQEKKILRIGVPPLRLEITTSISGIEFDECYQARIVDELDGIEVNLIDLENRQQNRQRNKADHRAHEQDHQRLDKRGQPLGTRQ